MPLYPFHRCFESVSWWHFNHSLVRTVSCRIIKVPKLITLQFQEYSLILCPMDAAKNLRRQRTCVLPVVQAMHVSRWIHILTILFPLNSLLTFNLSLLFCKMDYELEESSKLSSKRTIIFLICLWESSRYSRECEISIQCVDKDISQA